jgi:Peptidase inhibitor family I36
MIATHIKQWPLAAYTVLFLALPVAAADSAARPEGDGLSYRQAAARLQPTPSKPVCFYEHVNYQGRSTCLAEGSSAVPSGWNDVASSVRLFPGREVTLFSDIGGAGRSLRLTADTPNLVTLGFNDVVSSITVPVQGGCATGSCGATGIDVTAVQVTNTKGGSPVKGDVLRVTLTVRNGGPAGQVTLVPTISSTRFTELKKVNLPTMSATMNANETKQISGNFGPFLQDTESYKIFALGRGGYHIDDISIFGPNDTSSVDTSYSGAAFTLGASNAVFTALMYDVRYLEKVKSTLPPGAYLAEALTRPAEVYTPSAPNSNTGTYQTFAKGFDEMMNVRHIFRAFPSSFSGSTTGPGLCEQAALFTGPAIGLTKAWTTGAKVKTSVGNHGFDDVIGLTSETSGEVVCDGANLQVIGLAAADLSVERSQLAAAHAVGHLFGAPHCDPLQGYVMCAGELNEHYRQKGTHVWHKLSRDAMKNQFD